MEEQERVTERRGRRRRLKDLTNETTKERPSRKKERLMDGLIGRKEFNRLPPIRRVTTRLRPFNLGWRELTSKVASSQLSADQLGNQFVNF